MDLSEKALFSKTPLSSDVEALQSNTGGSYACEAAFSERRGCTCTKMVPFVLVVVFPRYNLK